METLIELTPEEKLVLHKKRHYEHRLKYIATENGRKKDTEHGKRYYASNKESIKEKRKEYYAQNREEILEKQREVYKKNKEILNELKELKALNGSKL